MERLSRTKMQVVRVGHVVKMLPSVLRFSLDYLVQHADNTALAADARSEVNKAFSQMKGKMTSAARRQLRSEIKALRQEITRRESDAVQEILKHANVVCTTLHGAGSCIFLIIFYVIIVVVVFLLLQKF